MFGKELRVENSLVFEDRCVDPDDDELVVAWWLEVEYPSVIGGVESDATVSSVGEISWCMLVQKFLAIGDSGLSALRLWVSL